MTTSDHSSIARMYRATSLSDAPGAGTCGRSGGVSKASGIVCASLPQDVKSAVNAIAATVRVRLAFNLGM